jgi:formimidoylglutamate deiminase
MLTVSTVSTQALFARDVLLPTGWAKNVLLEWNTAGILTTIRLGTSKPENISQAAGPVIAGMPNLHSHAFQRAFAGLTEFRSTQEDSFWSWRELMYRFSGRITPDQLEDIASFLYIEMLQAGYTSVCEFHYLHHDQAGRPYADDAEQCQRLIRAAARAGIGLTLLPVLYQSSGFGGQPPGFGQRRFIRSTENILRLIERLKLQVAQQDASGHVLNARFRVGLAPHSLRAVTPHSLAESVAGLHAMDPLAPVHIHIAEQRQEVHDCLAWSGQRPVQWLLEHAEVDARWCLVHATHLSEQEIVSLATSQAVVGLCPTTEANLGDGVFPLAAYQQACGRWGIGSDSHVCVNAAEELMLLEYGQRLTLGQRNVLATQNQPQVATALMLQAVAAGGQASGQAAGLLEGHSADMVMLNENHPVLVGLDAPDMLAAHLFASHRSSAVSNVWVAGVEHVQNGIHQDYARALERFVRARRALLQD